MRRRLMHFFALALAIAMSALESVFDRYQPAQGRAPTRPRTDADPLDRRAYLLHLQRRV